jgi:hypothetical protein
MYCDNEIWDRMFAREQVMIICHVKWSSYQTVPYKITTPRLYRNNFLRRREKQNGEAFIENMGLEGNCGSWSNLHTSWLTLNTFWCSKHLGWDCKKTRKAKGLYKKSKIMCTLKKRIKIWNTSSRVESFNDYMDISGVHERIIGDISLA